MYLSYPRATMLSIGMLICIPGSVGKPIHACCVPGPRVRARTSLFTDLLCPITPHGSAGIPVCMPTMSQLHRVVPWTRLGHILEPNATDGQDCFCSCCVPTPPRGIIDKPVPISVCPGTATVRVHLFTLAVSQLCLMAMQRCLFMCVEPQHHCAG